MVCFLTSQALHATLRSPFQGSGFVVAVTRGSQSLTPGYHRSPLRGYALIAVHENHIRPDRFLVVRRGEVESIVLAIALQIDDAKGEINEAILAELIEDRIAVAIGFDFFHEIHKASYSFGGADPSR